MAPRDEKAAAVEGDKITALCHLIMSCEAFSIDNAKLAPLLGIKDAKNVVAPSPRKLNTIVNPYGFEFRGGKLKKQGDDGASATPILTPKKASGGGDHGDEIVVAEELSEAPLPKTGRKKLPTKPRGKVTPSKKRKLEKAKDDAEEADDEASGVPAKEEKPTPALA